MREKALKHIETSIKSVREAEPKFAKLEYRETIGAIIAYQMVELLSADEADEYIKKAVDALCGID